MKQVAFISTTANVEEDLSAAVDALFTRFHAEHPGRRIVGAQHQITPILRRSLLLSFVVEHAAVV